MYLTNFTLSETGVGKSTLINELLRLLEVNTIDYVRINNEYYQDHQLESFELALQVMEGRIRERKKTANTATPFEDIEAMVHDEVQHMSGNINQVFAFPLWRKIFLSLTVLYVYTPVQHLVTMSNHKDQRWRPKVDAERRVSSDIASYCSSQNVDRWEWCPPAFLLPTLFFFSTFDFS